MDPKKHPDLEGFTISEEPEPTPEQMSENGSSHLEDLSEFYDADGLEAPDAHEAP